MDELHLTPDAVPDRRLVTEFARRLREGQVGILPTETVYGLFARADLPECRARICRIKQRELSKELQVMVPSLAELATLDIPLTPALRRLADAWWPGPLTIVVPDRAGRTHGVRIPDHAFLREVLTAMGVPLVATSANPAGTDPAVSLSRGFRDLAELPDFAVFAGPPIGGVASTVVRLVGEEAEGLREGAISFAEIGRTLAGIVRAPPSTAPSGMPPDAQG